MKDLAEVNEALPIGFGQTISQPLVVAFMLELLRPQPGDKILDVGSGSGYSSALLAEIVGGKGKIIAIDIIPELVEFARNNISKYNFVKKGIVKFVCGDGSKGLEEKSPFDKILCSATLGGKLPNAWKSQLKIGGRIVTPIKSSIWLFEKKSPKNPPKLRRNLGGSTGQAKYEFKSKEYPGFTFVPLIEK